MNLSFAIAAGLAALGALVHGIGGELTNMRSLRSASMHEGHRFEIRAVWHVYTWQLAISAAALAWLAANYASGAAPLARFVAWSFLGAGVGVALIALRAGVRRLLQHPQWLLLLAIGVLSWWGAR